MVEGLVSGLRELAESMVLMQQSNDSVIAKLEELRTMLDTRLAAETTAANTRSHNILTILGGSDGE